MRFPALFIVACSCKSLLPLFAANRKETNTKQKAVFVFAHSFAPFLTASACVVHLCASVFFIYCMAEVELKRLEAGAGGAGAAKAAIATSPPTAAGAAAATSSTPPQAGAGGAPAATAGAAGAAATEERPAPKLPYLALLAITLCETPCGICNSVLGYVGVRSLVPSLSASSDACI